ncbi:MAG: NUDIX hydrolase [Defluviitaleaceae bacterium]|nr:NUDIX hydrolase [Defluviitaleaceae bacterium]
MGYVEELRAIIGHKRIILNGSIAFIENPYGQILMQQRKYPYGKWGLPGGIMELGESTEETVRREVFEETGLTLGNVSLFGVYSGEKYLCIAQNGDEFYVVTTVYRTSEYSGDLSVNDDESLKFEWCDIHDLPENIAVTHRDIIGDYSSLANAKGYAPM